MPDNSKAAAICDANVLIDYIEADEDIIRELVEYWGQVHVPDVVLNEVKQLSRAQATTLGLIVVDTPFILPVAPGLSFPDRACLHFVKERGWTCIANDRLLRRECVNHGGQVVWGLEMLLHLVADKRMTEARALGIARKIHTSNPEIATKILEEFTAKLSKGVPKKPRKLK